jgi:hypothetical protein
VLVCIELQSFIFDIGSGSEKSYYLAFVKVKWVCFPIFNIPRCIGFVGKMFTVRVHCSKKLDFFVHLFIFFLLYKGPDIHLLLI